MQTTTRITTAVAACMAAFALRGEVRTATPFADNMVLQRGVAVPVWGTAAPGERVTVEFAGQRKSAAASAKGTWAVKLDPMSASKENRVMKVSGTSNTEEIRNVLVGEVWFASGQSNMDCPIWGWNPHYRDRKGAMMTGMMRRPYIRFSRTPLQWSATPKRDYKAKWWDYSPESFKSCGDMPSAVAFYYALELYGALEIPVGFIDSSWGGTNIDAWTPRSGYENHPLLAETASFPVTDKWDDSMRKGVISWANQQPTALWNGMVAAFAPFAIKGFIWYQGCHNAGEAGLYCEKMHALYDGWSKEFRNPGLKLYFVQLAPFGQSWYDIQLAQRKFAAEEKNAALIVTCDIGNVSDIHPNDKETVGQRLALHALRRDYGFEGLVDDAPEVKSWKVNGSGEFEIEFSDARRLYVYDPDWKQLKGFEIAGADGRFREAKVMNKVDPEGQVHGGTLRVAAEGVDKPRRLRYLYRHPYRGALYSVDSALPVGPFELDAREPMDGRKSLAKMGDALKIKELAGFRKLFVHDIPDGWKSAKDAGYSFDGTSKAGRFSRVAYVLELEDDKGSVDWVVATMDAFSQSPAELGVPAVSRASFQRKAVNLTVRTNRLGLDDRDASDGGFVEFTFRNYSGGCAFGGIGGDGGAYDFNDTLADDGGYGCLQIHDWKTRETILAYNRFEGGVPDVGIGTNRDGQPDWTFTGNAGDYRARRLTVLVK